MKDRWTGFRREFHIQQWIRTKCKYLMKFREMNGAKEIKSNKKWWSVNRRNTILFFCSECSILTGHFKHFDFFALKYFAIERAALGSCKSLLSKPRFDGSLDKPLLGSHSHIKYYKYLCAAHKFHFPIAKLVECLKFPGSLGILNEITWLNGNFAWRNLMFKAHTKQYRNEQEIHHKTLNHNRNNAELNCLYF